MESLCASPGKKERRGGRRVPTHSDCNRGGKKARADWGKGSSERDATPPPPAPEAREKGRATGLTLHPSRLPSPRSCLFAECRSYLLICFFLFLLVLYSVLLLALFSCRVVILFCLKGGGGGGTFDCGSRFLLLVISRVSEERRGATTNRSIVDKARQRKKECTHQTKKWKEWKNTKKKCARERHVSGHKKGGGGWDGGAEESHESERERERERERASVNFPELSEKIVKQGRKGKKRLCFCFFLFFSFETEKSKRSMKEEKKETTTTE